MDPTATSSLSVHPIEPTETWPLRASVLRPGHPIEDCDFDGDGDPDTFHAGVVLDDRVVGVASMYHEARAVDAPGGAELAPDHAAATTWRLRGMATDPDVRRRGVGAAALRACEDHVRAHDATLLWCNARIGAVAFYEAAGWAVLGEEFDLPGVGPHVVMERRVG